MASRLFITGIPTAGKSHLARKLAEAMGGVAVLLDDFREGLVMDERYQKWVNFYRNQDEEYYLTTVSPEQMLKNLTAQSEALWPAFFEEIKKYQKVSQPVIFECVNILPHLAQRDLHFPGIVLIGSSYGEILSRNLKDPRWGTDPKIQELESKMFFEVERPFYESEAKKYGYPVFENSDDAFDASLRLLAA